MRYRGPAAAGAFLTVLLAAVSTPAGATVHNIPRSFDVSALQLPQTAPRGPRETGCLAHAIYHEARGEPLMGRIAVAQVIVNRVKSAAYPDTICKVVYQNARWRNRCQFSFACDGISDRPRERTAWLAARRLAHEIMDAQDGAVAPRISQIGLLAPALRSATHYHADYVMPRWGRVKKRVGLIGRHIFYTSPRVTRSM